MWVFLTYWEMWDVVPSTPVKTKILASERDGGRRYGVSGPGQRTLWLCFMFTGDLCSPYPTRMLWGFSVQCIHGSHFLLTTSRYLTETTQARKKHFWLQVSAFHILIVTLLNSEFMQCASFCRLQKYAVSSLIVSLYYKITLHLIKVDLNILR